MKKRWSPRRLGRAAVDGPVFATIRAAVVAPVGVWRELSGIAAWISGAAAKAASAGDGVGICSVRGRIGVNSWDISPAIGNDIAAKDGECEESLTADVCVTECRCAKTDTVGAGSGLNVMCVRKFSPAVVQAVGIVAVWMLLPPSSTESSSSSVPAALALSTTAAGPAAPCAKGCPIGAALMSPMCMLTEAASPSEYASAAAATGAAAPCCAPPDSAAADCWANGECRML